MVEYVKVEPVDVPPREWRVTVPCSCVGIYDAETLMLLRVEYRCEQHQSNPGSEYE